MLEIYHYAAKVRILIRLRREKMFITPQKIVKRAFCYMKRSEFYIVQNIAPLGTYTNMILPNGFLSVYDIDALWQILSVATLAGEGVDGRGLGFIVQY